MSDIIRTGRPPAVDTGGSAGIAAPGISRRDFIRGVAIGAGAIGVFGLAGCATPGGLFGDVGARPAPRSVYDALPNERFPIPAADISQIDSRYLRANVRYESDEEPGTIIVDTGNFYVYRIEGDGRATRYGASVGAAGFQWSGEAYIGRKAEWPIWTPTRDQIGRDPSLVQYSGGMPPGLDNPLGARALYLYQDGVYTLYTIYGTIHARLIGVEFGSGCIGLLSQDIIHLFDQTPVGTKVIVLPA